MADRIVVSGRGLVTPIGVGIEENTEALKKGKTGTVFISEWRELGLDAQVAGMSNHDVECPVLNQKNKRFMSVNSRMAVVAAYEALLEAGFTMETLPHDMAVINGCGGSAYAEVYSNASAYMETRRIRKVSPFAVPRIMPSSAVANLSLVFGLTGESYDISSACTSSAQAIIAGARLIASGEYDTVMVGGSEEVSWQQALGFNAMRALSHSYNDMPHKASRPFDKNRDGFVLGEGAGILILERESHALARGHLPKAVISGFAANSNATDMVVPNAESSAELMRKAIRMAGLRPEEIGYINTHGTATPVGDPVEMESIRLVFDSSRDVAINSTKSMTGHMIGAAGAVEAIFTTLMLEKSFLCPTANLEEPSEEFAWADLIRETREHVELNHALSNSFGFGGSNACIVLSRWK